MIYFVGCSYTWGAGLQFELLSKRGWTASQINDIIPPKTHLEHLDYECDEYRKKHHFPNLVAKEMDMAYGLGKVGNGGANDELSHLLYVGSIYTLGGEGQCKIIIIQFTDWTRSSQEYKNGMKDEYGQSLLNDNTINKIIDKQIDSILDEVYTFGVGIKWFGLSWRNDLGLRLKQNYPNNFIPIYLNDKEYVSLEDTIVDDHTEFNTWHYEDKNNLRLSDTIHGVKDTHLSSIGHEVVAKSILRKIK